MNVYLSPRLNEPIKLLEVVERAAAFGTGSNLITHGIRSITSHSIAVLKEDIQNRQNVIDRFGCLDFQAVFSTVEPPQS